MDWEEYVTEIASDIMKEQSPKRFVHSDFVAFQRDLFKFSYWSVGYSVGPFLIQCILFKLDQTIVGIREAEIWFEKGDYALVVYGLSNLSWGSKEFKMP